MKRRELYLIEWSWLNQFPSSKTRGQTNVSSWDYILRYPHFKKIPAVVKSYDVEGGRIYLTDGVDDLFFKKRVEKKGDIPF